MDKLLFSLGVICFGLALGYAIQVITRKGYQPPGLDLDRLRKNLQKIGIWGFMSVSFTGAIWGLKLDDPRLAALPALGVAGLLAGGFLGLGAARLLGLGRLKTGTMFICGFFTNLGSVGGLICYVFMGEDGLALLMLYRIFEAVFYYTVGFSAAKYYSSEGANDGLKSRLKKVFTDPFPLVALSVIVVGAGLNLAGVPRPRFLEKVIAFCVPVGTTILLASIGMAMRFSRISAYTKEYLAISAIKFILTPALVGAAAYLIGYGDINMGLPLKVVLVAASMPVAFNALVAASLYDLELDMANTCWFVSTVALFLVVPWLYFLTNAF